MLWLVASAVAGLLAFAAYFEIDQAVRAQGQVIPGSRTQVIQAADGGMLTALHVREGAEVKAGDPLAELEPNRVQAVYSQGAAELASRRIALTRARAELRGTAPDFPRSDRRAWPAFVAAQQGLYLQRKQGLDAETSVLTASLHLASQELDMNQRLHEAGDISLAEVMRARRQVLDNQGRLDASRHKYLQENRLEIARLEDELAAGHHRQEERQVGLTHTRLFAPMDGVVKLLRINTVGGVLRPGDELMQISPVNDEMLVQLRINPTDVGQLFEGLPVVLRFDALDSSIFGSVPGVVRYVSPDTLTEQGPNGQQQIDYRAEVVLDWTSEKAVQRRIRAEDIKPGMTVTADILTGKRSILHFLAKPIVKAFRGATLPR